MQVSELDDTAASAPPGTGSSARAGCSPNTTPEPRKRNFASPYPASVATTVVSSAVPIADDHAVEQVGQDVLARARRRGSSSNVMCVKSAVCGACWRQDRRAGTSAATAQMIGSDEDAPTA